MSEAFEEMGYNPRQNANRFDTKGKFFNSIPDDIIYNGQVYTLDAAIDPQTGNKYIFAEGTNGETVQFRQTEKGLQLIEEL